MADNPLVDAALHPFSAFNFAVEIEVPDLSKRLVGAAFAECEGIEMTMEVKTLREGGNNGRQIRLAGPRGFGQLVLKRGMTSSFELWDWFDAVLVRPRLRASATVVVLAPDFKTERVRFVLERCLPVKLKAPALNAKEGLVAIEELHIAYEALRLDRGAASFAGRGGGA